MIQEYFFRRYTTLERIPGEVRKRHGRPGEEVVDPLIESTQMGWNHGYRTRLTRYRTVDRHFR